MVQIYHATCHAEAVSSTNNLAARLRNEIEGRSRSETPEVPSLRLTPPKSVLNNSIRTSLSPSPESKKGGTKRKVDDSSESDDGKPPLKKLEVSA
jgi:pre-mRNA cleavage complex 2 protein Pcf11